jgi:hypothetical protein
LGYRKAMFKSRIAKMEKPLLRAFAMLTHIRDAMRALKRGGLSPPTPKRRAIKPPSVETLERREAAKARRAASAKAKRQAAKAAREAVTPTSSTDGEKATWPATAEEDDARDSRPVVGAKARRPVFGGKRFALVEASRPKEDSDDKEESDDEEDDEDDDAEDMVE